jgi:hypothetical protein
MLTHEQVKRRNSKWRQWYGEDSPQLAKARTKADAGKQGIHLLNPTQDEITNAWERAAHDLFPIIWIHTAKTWPKAGAK